MLVTILVTDIVDSTQRVAEMGDRAWRALLDRHDEATRKQINQFGGREVGYRGDGVVAIFDSPARAVRCAAAIIPLVAALGIALRCGIHVGEVHVGGKKISGIAVHIAARIMAKAGPNEIFLSKIVSDLVTGSGFVFEDRGICELRGLPTKIHLYAMPMVIGAPDTGIVELKSSARLSDLRGNLSQGVCSR